MAIEDYQEPVLEEEIPDPVEYVKDKAING